MFSCIALKSGSLSQWVAHCVAEYNGKSVWFMRFGGSTDHNAQSDSKAHNLISKLEVSGQSHWAMKDEIAVYLFGLWADIQLSEKCVCVLAI